MSKNKTKFIVDTIGYFSFLVLLSTGIVMKYIVLPGSRRVEGDATSLWNLTRHEWGDIHFWASVVFVLSLLIHMWLHWSWISSTLGRYARIKMRIGVVAALILPLMIAVLPLFGPRGTEDDDAHRRRGGRSENIGSIYEGEGRGSNGPATFHIRGRDSLEEIARNSGVKTDDILTELGLPADTPRNERLSRLRDLYGFEMHEVRDVVSRLAAKNPSSP